MYMADKSVTDTHIINYFIFPRLDMSHWSLSTSSEESGAPRHQTPDTKREHTLVTVTGGRGYVNLQQPCCTTITNNAHILLWEMKL